MRAAAVAALVLAVLCLSPTAHADRGPDDTRPCVTPEEFSTLDLGMTRLQVQAILDGPGGVFEPGTDRALIVRRYPRCGLRWHHGRVVVLYLRDTDRLYDALEVRYR